MKAVKLINPDGQEVYRGSEEGAWVTLLRSQHQSTAYALEYGGWKILSIEDQDEAKAALESDPFRRVEFFGEKIECKFIFGTYEGKPVKVNINAIYGMPSNQPAKYATCFKHIQFL